MASRTTAAEVKKILETSLSDGTESETDNDLLGFLTSANAFVTAHLGSVSPELPDSLLSEIEKWIAAHLIASTREQQLSKAGAGEGVEATFQGRTGMGLASTFYGQNAVSLDTSGVLANLAKGGYKQVSFFAVGGT